MYHVDGNDHVYTRSNFFVDYGAAVLASFILHPLHFFEARWVLNNRLPNFQAYKSTITMFHEEKNQIPRGMTAYLPRNLILAMTGYNYFGAVNF
jgi:hypothetical protein